ncbi:MAG TPA: XTP/dITP diphosphatase [Candidatus Kapabacteria bacterium]|nr:XTP/dITP diphosphatase [Candidatus Kapabacteria bacterium]
MATKMTIVLATTNSGKIKEIQDVLDEMNIEVMSMGDAGYNAPIEETGRTFEENALLKARTVHTHIDYPILADDSGLEVNILGSAPGVFSARYAGVDQSETANRAKLLKEMKDISDDNRKARFRCALAYIDEYGEHIFEGVCDGRITTEERGTKGFGYDPVFIPEGSDKTFAEMSAEEKNSVSHRGKALTALKRYLQKTVND